MSKKTKLIASSAIVLCVLFTVALLWLSANAGSLIKSGIEKFGPDICGVPIEVGEVYLVPFMGKARISGLKIHNPKGYEEKYLMVLDSISMDLDLKSLLSSVITINSIKVKNPEIDWEGSLSESNVTKLQGNVERYTGSSNSKSEKKFMIHELSVVGVKARAKVAAFKPIKLELPPIEMKNIGSENKSAAANKVIGMVVAEISKKIMIELANNPEVRRAAENAAKQILNGVTDGIKGLFK